MTTNIWIQIKGWKELSKYLIIQLRYIYYKQVTADNAGA
jgi:hypothetical protein